MTYQIGEFSRITGFSVKTLRYYHEQSLISPVHIDPDSGYRYYDEVALHRAEVVKALRDLDFSIKEIRDVLRDCEDDQDMVAILTQKNAEIFSKIEKYQAMSKQIHQIIKQQEDIVLNNRQKSIVEKVVEDTLVAYIAVTDTYSESGRYIKKLYKRCGRFIAGKAMCVYDMETHESEKPSYEVCIPVRKPITEDDIQSKILPGGTVVSKIHQGPYGTQGSAYKALFDYMESKGLKRVHSPREIFVKGPGLIFTGNPKNYLTEIQVAVEHP